MELLKLQRFFCGSVYIAYENANSWVYLSKMT